MQNRIAVAHDDLEESGQDRPQRRDRREDADDRNQHNVRQPPIPVRLHGEQHVQKHHDQQQEEHLLQRRDEDPVLGPSAHVHQVDDRLRGVEGVDHKVDQGVDEGDAERQDSIADEAAEVGILLARAQVHELCKVVEHEEEGGQDGEQPRVIPVAQNDVAGGGGANRHNRREEKTEPVACKQALEDCKGRLHRLEPPLCPTI